MRNFKKTLTIFSILMNLQEIMFMLKRIISQRFSRPLIM